MENSINVNGKELRIVLFVNKGKKTEAHPDYNGIVEIGEKDNEQKYKVVMWKNKAKGTGATYLSGKIDFTKVMEEKKKEAVTETTGDGF